MQRGGITETHKFFSGLNMLEGFVHIASELHFRVDHLLPYPIGLVARHNKSVIGVNRHSGDFFEFLDSLFYPGLYQINIQLAAHAPDYFIRALIDNGGYQSDHVGFFSQQRDDGGIAHRVFTRVGAVNIIHYIRNDEAGLSHSLAGFGSQGKSELSCFG